MQQEIQKSPHPCLKVGDEKCYMNAQSGKQFLYAITSEQDIYVSCYIQLSFCQVPP